MAKANIVKWGNSLALRIPKTLAGTLRIGERSEVSLNVRDGVLVVAPAESLPEFTDAQMRRGLRMLSKATRKARVASLDLGKPVGRESW